MTLNEVLQLNIKNGHYITLNVSSSRTRKGRTVIKNYKVNGRFGVYYYNLKSVKNRATKPESENSSKTTWFKHTDHKSIVVKRDDESQVYLQIVNPQLLSIHYTDEEGIEIPYKTLVDEGFIKTSNNNEEKLILTINLKNIKAINYKNK